MGAVKAKERTAGFHPSTLLKMLLLTLSQVSDNCSTLIRFVVVVVVVKTYMSVAMDYKMEYKTPGA